MAYTEMHTILGKTETKSGLEISYLNKFPICESCLMATIRPSCLADRLQTRKILLRNCYHASGESGVLNKYIAELYSISPQETDSLVGKNTPNCVHMPQSRWNRGKAGE